MKTLMAKTLNGGKQVNSSNTGHAGSLSLFSTGDLKFTFPMKPFVGAFQNCELLKCA